VIWFYFDANALVKRYSTETGTELINELFRGVSVTQMTCLTLSVLEVMSILVRKKNDGRLSPIAFDQAMINFRSEVINSKEFAKAAINDILVMSAFAFIAKHSINSTDAVILRSVLNLKNELDTTGDQLVLLSSDKRLVKAARNENAIVFDPEVETLTSLQQLLATSI